MKKGIILFILTFIVFSISVRSEERVHLVGVRWGYNISSVTFDPDRDHFGITSAKNYSVLYTYYHPDSGNNPYFGFQTGLSLWQTGHKTDLYEERIEMASIPLVSQFHVDFWKMRVLLNLGGYGGYRLKKTVYDLSGSGDAAGTTGFDELDNRIEFGIVAGAGLSYILKPFELQVEANYNYSLSYLYYPRKFDTASPLYTYPNHLIFSVAILLHIKSR